MTLINFSKSEVFVNLNISFVRLGDDHCNIFIVRTDGSNLDSTVYSELTNLEKRYTFVVENLESTVLSNSLLLTGIERKFVYPTQLFNWIDGRTEYDFRFDSFESAFEYAQLNDLDENMFASCIEEVECKYRKWFRSHTRTEIRIKNMSNAMFLKNKSTEFRLELKDFPASVFSKHIDELID